MATPEGHDKLVIEVGFMIFMVLGVIAILALAAYMETTYTPSSADGDDVPQTQSE